MAGLGFGSWAWCEIGQPVRFRPGGVESDSAERRCEKDDDGSFSHQTSRRRASPGRKSAVCLPAPCSSGTGKRPRTGSLPAGDKKLPRIPAVRLTKSLGDQVDFR